MPVKGDLEYFKNMGEAGFHHATNKPWSDAHCGLYLMELGAMMGLMPRQGKLLDLGCGTGWTSYYFAKMGYDVVGQDVAPEAIAHAKKMASESGMANLSFIESDYESLQLNPEFDITVFFDSLHHSLDENLAIQSAFRALKKGGILITSEPGVGHEKRSQAEIKKWGVTERDMHPGKIIKAGKAAGFTSFKVYPHASFLYISLFRQAPSGMLGRIFSIFGMRSLAAMFTILFYKHFSGIVVLRK